MTSVPETLRFIVGARIYLDTNVFIYGVEGGDQWRPLWSVLWQLIQSKQVQAVTSELSLAEALVWPIKKVDRKAQAEFGKLITPSEELAVIPLNRQILLEAARLRAIHGLEMPDAMHAATAKIARCRFFLTNDAKLAEAAGAKAVLLERLQIQSA